MTKLAWAALATLLAWAKIAAGSVYGLMGLCEKTTGKPPDERASKGPIDRSPESKGFPCKIDRESNIVWVSVSVVVFYMMRVSNNPE
jgi:hypothetical protein